MNQDSDLPKNNRRKWKAESQQSGGQKNSATILYVLLGLGVFGMLVLGSCTCLVLLGISRRPVSDKPFDSPIPQATPQAQPQRRGNLQLTSNEVKPFNILEQIHEARIDYLKLKISKSDVTSVKELCEAGLIDQSLSSGEMHGYKFSVGRFRGLFSATMTPTSKTIGNRQIRMLDRRFPVVFCRPDANSKWVEIRYK